MTHINRIAFTALALARAATAAQAHTSIWPRESHLHRPHGQIGAGLAAE